jgi:hypothetical protein
MKASLDTNVIIHLYRSDAQQILFDRFDEGIVVSSFIYNLELQRHGQSILKSFQMDVDKKKIKIIDNAFLNKLGMLSSFNEFVKTERILYSPKDLGEVYATALARVLGVFSVVTDDVKPGGPYYTLMRMPESDVIPFSFCDIIFLNFLDSKISARDVIKLFCLITSNASMHWNIETQLKNFIRRFWTNPYTSREKGWMSSFCRIHRIKIKSKMNELYSNIRSSHL